MARARKPVGRVTPAGQANAGKAVVYNSQTNLYTETVTVRPRGTVTGPLSLELTNLPSSVALTGCASALASTCSSESGGASALCRAPRYLVRRNANETAPLRPRNPLRRAAIDSRLELGDVMRA